MISSCGRSIVFILLLFIPVACSVTGTTSKEELMSLLPKIQGWQSSYNPEYYDRTSLYDYINGGAEKYLNMSFQAVVVQRVRKADDEITVEIYRMKNTADAEKLYRENRSGEEIGLGNGGSYGKGYLVYWYEHYVVVVMTVSATPTIEKYMYKFGSTIYKKIQSIQ